MFIAGGLLASIAAAQDMPAAPMPAAPAPSATAPTPAAPAVVIPPAPQQLSQAQLDQLVAPIALYPDPLLGQVLMASTYPLEVVEASRWLRVPANRGLADGALTAALQSKEWDPSVMALVPVPGLLAILADKLEWTEQLGDALLAQQGDVMAAVQRLRHAALQAGNLKATPECHCVIQTSGDLISILPADAQLVAIPVYNPAVAYGTWPDAAYPPAGFPLPAGFVFAPGIVVGFDPAIEVALFGPLWGWSSLDWSNHRIVVDNVRYAAIAPHHPAFAGGVWAHDPAPHHAAPFTAPPVVVLRGGGRPAGAPPVGHVAVAHSPRPYWLPRHHFTGFPPGTLVPPPPPPRHVAHDWHGGAYDRFR